MLVDMTPGWTLEMDRGPDWLFIRPVPQAEAVNVECDLAEAVWERLEQQFLNRIVLEMDAVPLLRSWLIGQLVLLHKRVVSRGGVVRLAGMSDDNQRVLKMVHLDDRFPQYTDRGAAVTGHRPTQPR